jgi:hypothetical protein
MRLIAIGFIAALAALAIGLAQKTTPASGTTAGAPGHDPAPLPTGGYAPTHRGGPPSAATSAHFSVFQRARSARDELGTRARGGMMDHIFVDQTYLASKLSPTSGRGRATDSDIFVAGGPNDSICLLNIPPGADGPGGECVGTQDAQTGRAVVTQERGSDVDIFGVVPDGIGEVTVTLADGTWTVLPVSQNVYSATLASATKSVSWDGPDGAVAVDASSS